MKKDFKLDINKYIYMCIKFNVHTQKINNENQTYYLVLNCGQQLLASIVYIPKL